MAWTKAGRERKNGAGNLASDDLRVVAVVLSALTAAKAITGATNATPIVITSAAHGFANGDEVQIVGVGGNANANGYFIVSNVTTNTFEITNPYTGANIAGSGAYTSGGYVLPLGSTGLDNLNDVDAGARAAVSATLTGVTITGGVLDANDFSFTSVPAGSPIRALLLYYHSGTEATSTLLLWITSSDLPITPDGNNINVTWDNGVNRISRELG